MNIVLHSSKGKLLLSFIYLRWWEANISLLIFLIVSSSFSAHVLYLRINGYLRSGCFHWKGWPYWGYLGRHEHRCWLCLRMFSGHHHLPAAPKSHMFTTWHLLDLYRTHHFGEIDKQSLSPSKVYNKCLLSGCEYSQHW